MGWKTIREHFGIQHIVKVVDGSIHIGSSYVGDLIVVSPQGAVTLNRTFSTSPELMQLRDAMEEDRDGLVAMMDAPDTFERSIPTWTWEEDALIERFCEAEGWPNVTHDGRLMHDNRYSRDRRTVLAWARRDAESRVLNLRESIGEVEGSLAEMRARLDGALSIRARLGADDDEVGETTLP